MKRNKQTDILFITISSFVVVVCWIGFSLYHIWATSTISPDLQLQVTPISPEFDLDTLNTLKTRLQITPNYQIQAPVTTPATPPTLPTPALSASNSSQVVSSASGTSFSIQGQ